MKNQKGITLIALILTIIIMLILVGVTINFALNRGIITKAKEASSQTQIEADKETLMMVALGTINTNGELDLSQMETPTGFTKVATGKYTKGGNTYTVNPTTGAVTVRSGGQDEETTEKSVVGTYSTYYADNGQVADVQMIVELDDNNNARMNVFGNAIYTADYIFDEENNVVTLSNIEGPSTERNEEWPFVVYFCNNNKILIGDGLGVLTSNGFAGFDVIPEGALGTYVDENENQITVVRTTSYEMFYGANLGAIQYIQGGSNAQDMFAYIDGEFEYFMQDIEFSQDYSTLTKDGIVYTKTN